jgi:hypothetical protein
VDTAELGSPESVLFAAVLPLRALAPFWKAVKFFALFSTALIALKRHFRINCGAKK